jgi:hypothetical protein
MFFGSKGHFSEEIMKSATLLSLLLTFACLPAFGAVFDVISTENLEVSGGGTALGTSNGVGWAISPTSIWSSMTYTGENYHGYENESLFTPTLPDSDTLHASGKSFNLTFDQTIVSALVYLTDNDSACDGQLDFGITPTYVSGHVTIDGTTFRCSSTDGGLVRLDNINSNVLHHVAASSQGGLTFAIVVTPSEVPEPTSVAIWSALAFVLAATRRRSAA